MSMEKYSDQYWHAIAWFVVETRHDENNKKKFVVNSHYTMKWGVSPIDQARIKSNESHLIAIAREYLLVNQQEKAWFVEDVNKTTKYLLKRYDFYCAEANKWLTAKEFAKKLKGHLDAMETWARYDTDFMEGAPVLTKNDFVTE